MILLSLKLSITVPQETSKMNIDEELKEAREEAWTAANSARVAAWSANSAVRTAASSAAWSADCSAARSARSAVSEEERQKQVDMVKELL